MKNPIYCDICSVSKKKRLATRTGVFNTPYGTSVSLINTCKKCKRVGDHVTEKIICSLLGEAKSWSDAKGVKTWKH